MPQTVEFRCPHRSKYRVLQSGEEAGHAVGPPRATHVPETRSSRISKQREENVEEHHHAWTITESQSADRHIATALEGSSVGKYGKQTGGRKEGSRSLSPAISAWKGKVDNLSISSADLNSETVLQQARVSVTRCYCIVM